MLEGGDHGEHPRQEMRTQHQNVLTRNRYTAGRLTSRPSSAIPQTRSPLDTRVPHEYIDLPGSFSREAYSSARPRTSLTYSQDTRGVYVLAASTTFITILASRVHASLRPHRRRQGGHRGREGARGKGLVGGRGGEGRKERGRRKRRSSRMMVGVSTQPALPSVAPRATRRRPPWSILIATSAQTPGACSSIKAVPDLSTTRTICGLCGS